MGMRADGEIDRSEALGDRDEFRALAATRVEIVDHALDAGGFGARHDGLDLVGEIGEVEVAMAVDQLHATHAPFLTCGGRRRAAGATDEGSRRYAREDKTPARRPLAPKGRSAVRSLPQEESRAARLVSSRLSFRRRLDST